MITRWRVKQSNDPPSPIPTNHSGKKGWTYSIIRLSIEVYESIFLFVIYTILYIEWCVIYS